MALTFGEHVYTTDAGPRAAVVVTPSAHVRVGRARLEELRASHAGGSIDREILAYAEQTAGEDRVFVFRGTNDDGTGSWRIDDDLSEDELEELGAHLVEDQLPTYRRLVAAGIFALLHVDWTERGVRAYEVGTRRVLADLEAGSIPEVAVLDRDQVAVSRVDRWILRHLTFFFAESFDEVIAGVLALQHPLLERRVPALRQMVASLPASAID